MGQPAHPSLASFGAREAAAQIDAPATHQFTYDPSHFTLADMVRCGKALRALAADSASMEEAAQKITRHLYENLGDRTSNHRSCVLVRLFKTHVYARLTAELRESVVSNSPHSLTDDTKCLTLLASAGDDPGWNSRHTSRMHKCIPLISAAIVEQFPMISQLIHQLGLTTTELLRATPEIIRDLSQKKFGVFHVPVALDSPFVPAQKDFVKPYAIASAFGFGGVLPDGDLFAVIAFTRVEVSSSTAEMFRAVAVNLKLGLLDLLDKPVFAQ
jgi:hypothetical protein